MSSPSYKCNLCGLEWGMGAGDKPWITHQCTGTTGRPKQKTPEELATEYAISRTHTCPTEASLRREAFLAGYHAGYDAGFTQRKEWGKDGRE